MAYRVSRGIEESE
ncbi:Protein of unknown function [Bacillus cereus]|nr:Protein of unknown function [Bacillus mobilis]SCN29565.1 Protein of unknown function [Bacillus cereus]